MTIKVNVQIKKLKRRYCHSAIVKIFHTNKTSYSSQSLAVAHSGRVDSTLCNEEQCVLNKFENNAFRNWRGSAVTG